MPMPSAASWPSALLWDVDGTLAETELDGHRRAFNRAFADAALPWRWDRATYVELLRISGGRERMAHYLRQQQGADPSPQLIEALQDAKQRHYQDLLQGGAIALRPGVARLMAAAAAAGVPQAIVTTSGRAAVEALLQRLLPTLLPAMAFSVCGEDVARKKPHPEAYQQALERLDLAAETVLALEDSSQGLRAARGAGLPVLITRSAASSQDPLEQFSAAAAVLDHLGDPQAPCRVLAGPPCPEGVITLSYLQQLLPQP